jgi:hypothetical protein
MVVLRKENIAQANFQGLKKLKLAAQKSLVYRAGLA